MDFQIKPEFQTLESLQDKAVAEEHALMLLVSRFTLITV
jgi:hypothetical protein